MVQTMPSQRASRDDIQTEVDANYKAFQKLLPDLMTTNAGQFVLMHNREIIDQFDSIGDAVKFGNEKYPDGLFSVQEITTTVSDLGYFSHAMLDATV